MLHHFLPIKEWSQAICDGNRRALSKAITLVESDHDADQQYAVQLLENLQKTNKKTYRIGISGTPGVGKSSFLEKLGNIMCTKHTLALLAIDPSSHHGSGALLADKTRMENLSRQSNVYIRPSASSHGWGGMTRKTKDVISLCEAAGYEYIMVESVGAGQSDVAIAELADIFLLLLQPGAGDDLQAIKRGAMEMADMLIITKGDGVLLQKAFHAKAQLQNTLPLLRARSEHWEIPIMISSVLNTQDKEITSFEEIFEKINHFLLHQKKHRMFDQRRISGEKITRERLMKEVIFELYSKRPDIQDLIAHYEKNPHISLSRIILDLKTMIHP